MARSIHCGVGFTRPSYRWGRASGADTAMGWKALSARMRKLVRIPGSLPVFKGIKAING